MGNGSQNPPGNLQPKRESKFPQRSRENSPRKKPNGNGKRLSRLLRIMDMLQSGRVYNSQDLAQLCGVSRRTVFRDIAALQDAGLSVLQDESRRGYFLPNRKRRPSTESAPADALSRANVCGEQSETGQAISFPSPVWTVAAKISRNLPRHVFRDSQGPCEVVIQFAADVARNVADVNWHHTQHTKFFPDGRLEFRVTVDGLEEISWWILGFGDRAVVLQPPELRDRLRSHAENMVRSYGSSAESK
jgi:predicted DNA-binding transcriptional regulator YafY